MGRIFFRKTLFVWGMLIAGFFVACSQGDTSPTRPGDDSRSSPEGTLQSSQEEPGDSASSGAGKKDTVYHHREVTVYRDTVEKVSEVHGTSFLSFVYKKNSGVLDTVTRDSNALKCDMGEESFSCEYFAQYIIENPPIKDPIIIKDTIRLTPLDTTKVHIYVVDTVYKDTFYQNTYKRINDTTFINYGESRMTDYIPPERVYDPGRFPFDSAAIRDFFDTLDVSDSLLGGKDHLEINSDLRFHGFPLTVRERVQVGVIVQDVMFRNVKIWPEKWGPEEHYYQIERDNTLEADTTVTWTLEYTHYERGQEERNSIQVTTFFKTARASLGD